MHDDAATAIPTPPAPVLPIGRARAASAALVELLVVERDRWFLWLPVLFGLGSAGCFGSPSLPPLGLGIAAVVVGLGLLLATMGLSGRSMEGAVAIAAASSALALGFGVAVARTHMVAAPVLEREGTFALEGRIIAIEETARGARVLLDRLAIERLDPARTPVRVRINLRGDLSLQPGDRIAARARLQPPMGPVMPGGFDYARQAWFEQLGALGYAFGTPRVVGHADEGAGLGIARLRASISESITRHASGDAGAVSAALLTGVRAGITDRVWRDFQISGLAHILSISGLHMVLVAAVTVACLRYTLALVPPLALRVPVKKIAAVVAIGVTAFYMVLAGGTVPTQRSFLMIAVALVGVLTDRDPFSMRLLAIAALLVLAWRPEALLGASFQLSFSAVMALVAVYESRAVRERLRGKEDDRMAMRVARYAIGVTATTLIASTATAPLGAFHFQTVPTYGVLANLLAVPVTSFWIMPMGMLSVLAMPLGLEGWFVPPMAWGVDALLLIARLTAALPGASITVGLMPVASLTLVAIGGLWACLWRERWRWLGMAPMALGLAIGLLHRPPDMLVSRDFEMLAVGLPGGRVAMVEWSRDRLVRESWLRGLGTGAEPVRVAPLAGGIGGLGCDLSGCVLRREGRAVSLVRRSDALRDDCRRADLVLSRSGSCRSDADFRGWWDIYDGGGGAIRFGRDGPEIRTVNEARGRWPWVPRAGPPSAR
ncbi:MAG TPA: ComEC/Rec2 family competence protein [Geminicoccaceae bacterium]|nr:ComEC/Rec2 family competence protein [Geminicoccus sp.]HMU51296.1 ComEC/Rec2 family competence protein [Geminicoccaceae bacterium]